MCMNKNGTLLLSLSPAWVLFVTAVGPLLVFLLEDTFADIFLLLVMVTLVVCSYLNATPTQKYPSSINWLSRF
jgi:Mn2+/Fe2+ NRAMP family transporter